MSQKEISFLPYSTFSSAGLSTVVRLGLVRTVDIGLLSPAASLSSASGRPKGSGSVFAARTDRAPL